MDVAAGWEEGENAEVGVECALVISEVPVWFKHTLF